MRSLFNHSSPHPEPLRGKTVVRQGMPERGGKAAMEGKQRRTPKPPGKLPAEGRRLLLQFDSSQKSELKSWSFCQGLSLAQNHTRLGEGFRRAHRNFYKGIATPGPSHTPHYRGREENLLERSMQLPHQARTARANASGTQARFSALPSEPHLVAAHTQ